MLNRADIVDKKQQKYECNEIGTDLTQKEHNGVHMPVCNMYVCNMVYNMKSMEIHKM